MEALLRCCITSHQHALRLAVDRWHRRVRESNIQTTPKEAFFYSITRVRLVVVVAVVVVPDKYMAMATQQEFFPLPT